MYINTWKSPCVINKCIVCVLMWWGDHLPLVCVCAYKVCGHRYVTLYCTQFQGNGNTFVDKINRGWENFVTAKSTMKIAKISTPWKLPTIYGSRLTVYCFIASLLLTVICMCIPYQYYCVLTHVVFRSVNFLGLAYPAIFWPWYYTVHVIMSACACTYLWYIALDRVQ